MLIRTTWYFSNLKDRSPGSDFKFLLLKHRSIQHHPFIPQTHQTIATNQGVDTEPPQLFDRVWRYLNNRLEDSPRGRNHPGAEHLWSLNRRRRCMVYSRDSSGELLIFDDAWLIYGLNPQKPHRFFEEDLSSLDEDWTFDSDPEDGSDGLRYPPTEFIIEPHQMVAQEESDKHSLLKYAMIPSPCVENNRYVFAQLRMPNTSRDDARAIWSFVNRFGRGRYNEIQLINFQMAQNKELSGLDDKSELAKHLKEASPTVTIVLLNDIEPTLDTFFAEIMDACRAGCRPWLRDESPIIPWSSFPQPAPSNAGSNTKKADQGGSERQRDVKGQGEDYGFPMGPMMRRLVKGNRGGRDIEIRGLRVDDEADGDPLYQTSSPQASSPPPDQESGTAKRIDGGDGETEGGEVEGGLEGVFRGFHNCQVRAMGLQCGRISIIVGIVH